MRWSRLLVVRGGESEYFPFICWFSGFLHDFLSSQTRTLSQNGRVCCNLFFRRVKHKISFWHQSPEELTLLYQIVQDWYFHHVSSGKVVTFKASLRWDNHCNWTAQPTFVMIVLLMKNEDEEWIISAICCLQHCFGVRVRHCTLGGHVEGESLKKQ